MKAKASLGAGTLVLGAALFGPAATRIVPVTISPAVAPLAAQSSSEELTTESRSAQRRSTDARKLLETTSAKRLEGPWQASCSYWGLPPGDADPKAADSAAVCGPNNWGSIRVKTAFTESANSTAAAKKGKPPAARPSEDMVTRPITALIATLPDPIHSSVAFEFDRMIDVMTQAAGDNGYVLSYYWLPWKLPRDKASKKETSTEEAAAEDREREPGLLILKPADAACDLVQDESDSRCDVTEPHVIYVFLVAQTAALGVNRTELAKAVQYEKYLSEQKFANLSFKDPLHEADVIGPANSGAASSLRAGLAHGFPAEISTISIAGDTTTISASNALNPESTSPRFHYQSFDEDAENETKAIKSFFNDPPFGKSRLAFLSETGTTFGVAAQISQKGDSERSVNGADNSASCTKRGIEPKEKPDPSDGPVLSIPFPREISVLRNASKDDKTATDAAAAAVADADPYLHLSLKGDTVEDTVPHFGREFAPYAQEAEWMALIRELKEHHTETVAISASSALDELFLAKALQRDLPGARAAFYIASDLMFVRAGDSAPYVGSVFATAYPLTALVHGSGSNHLDNFADFASEGFYNAVSYTLWEPKPGDPKQSKPLHLGGYTPSPDGKTMEPPPLWITTVGHDGYYPLAILNRCDSMVPSILPQIEIANGATHSCHDAIPEEKPSDVQASIAANLGAEAAFPGIAWYILSAAICLLCLAHALCLSTAQFFSPALRDLAIAQSDEPRRRAVYLNIGAAMLFTMSAVSSIPAIFAWWNLGLRGALAVACVTWAFGIMAAVLTLYRTWRFRKTPATSAARNSQRCGYQPNYAERRYLLSETRLYHFFNGLALLVALVTPAIWAVLCSNVYVGDRWFAGTFFSYRCLHPESGVSPLLPMLLLLVSWCLWAFFQTHRLRFSPNSRPILPDRVEAPGLPSPPYVSDEQLGDCSTALSSCLYENTSCLLITHRLLWRLAKPVRSRLNGVFLGVYLLGFAGFVYFAPIRGLDRYLRPHLGRVTPYEFLMSALFFPLLVIALTGSLRMLLIWTSLRSGLLDRLERSPLRFAFSRLTNVSWMTMLRQSGTVEYWRDMTRANESMRQILYNREITDMTVNCDEQTWLAALKAHTDVKDYALKLQDMMRDPQSVKWDAAGNFLTGDDLPSENDRGPLNLMCAIECAYVRFSNALLSCILLPYWSFRHVAMVESETFSEDGKLSASASAAPHPVQLAEEFLALRYFSLIRAILINLRQLMTFVSVSFVLALIAWNSYPFQPRQWVDWGFTVLLVGLGAAVVWVFAQMHRDPILSRITGTEANKLGIDFFIRLAIFGAAPVLTWMASQFPAIGATISQLLQSGMAVAK